MSAQESKTQVFRASTYTEAVMKAQKELGKDFHVVTRRDVKEKTLFNMITAGKLGGECIAVELEVAPMEPEEERVRKLPPPPEKHPLLLRSYEKARERAEMHDAGAKQAMTAAAAPYVSVTESATGIAGRLDQFQRELEKSSRENANLRDELRMLVTLQARGGVPAVSPGLLDSYRRLTENDVADALAREIVEEMQRGGCPDDPGETETALLQAIARRFPTAGSLLFSGDGPTVVALVGASGVGKSTSVAKLAIHFMMKMQKTVGIINEDRRRPGAESQVENLNRVLGIPVSTASEPDEIRNAVKSMGNRDLILLDTGGRSPRDAGGIRRLSAILGAAGAHETHLLLSGVSSEKTMRETVARFAPTGFNRLILTKLDECVSFGGLLNVGTEFSEGLSYVTCGPDYTRPIEAADAAALAELVLGLREIDAGSDASGEA